MKIENTITNKKKLKKLIKHTDVNNDEKRVLQRIVDYMNDKRQAPTVYMYNLAIDIYKRIYGEDFNEE